MNSDLLNPVKNDGCKSLNTLTANLSVLSIAGFYRHQQVCDENAQFSLYPY